MKVSVTGVKNVNDKIFIQKVSQAEMCGASGGQRDRVVALVVPVES